MKSWNQTPLLKCALAMTLGILSEPLIHQLAWVVLLIGALLWLGGHLASRRSAQVWDVVASLGIWIIFMGMGTGFRYLELKVGAPTLTKETPFQGWVEGVVINNPKQSPFGWSMQMEVKASHDSLGWHQQQARIMVYLPMGEAPASFDKIQLWGKLEPVKTKSDGFRSYLLSRGISLQVKGKQWEKVGQASGWKPMAWKVQQNFSHQLGELIADTTQLGVATAMLLGDRTLLSRDLNKDFAGTGLSHVLSISGMHIGVVYLLLTQVFAFLLLFKGGRIVQSLLILFLLLAYMFITGASPEVVRSVLMFGSVLIVKIFHRRHKMLNVLAIPALLQMAIQPSVVYMIGFQLSYSAVIGIAVFMPWFQRVFFVGNYWWDMLAGWIGVSLAATLATFPLVWFHFGTFPTHFLVANILSSFLVTLIVFLGFIMVLLATVPGIGAFLGLCVGTLIDWLNILAHEITALPASIITRWSWQEPACQVLLLEVVGFMLMLSIPVLIRHLRNKSQTLEPVPQGIWG